MATFTNQATLSYNGGSTNSNIITGEIVDVLTASKTAVVDTYRTPDKITYVVSLVNTGTLALTNLTLTDNLGAYTVGANTIYPLNYIAGSVRYYTMARSQHRRQSQQVHLLPLPEYLFRQEEMLLSYMRLQPMILHLVAMRTLLSTP